MPGSRNGVRGISSRSAREVLGRGGADHGADVVQAARRGPARRGRRRAARRAPTALAALGRRSSTSAAPGFDVRTSTNTPAPAARGTRGAASRRPSSGLAVKASAPRPGTVAERRRRRAGQRLGVGGGGDVDVAALGVGEHEQALRRGRARRRARSAAPAVGAEALEAGELRLDRDAGGAGRVDGRRAVRRDRDGGALGR